MPTPLQILLDPVSLTVLGLYGALILLEALFPARPLPCPRLTCVDRARPCLARYLLLPERICGEIRPVLSALTLPRLRFPDLPAQSCCPRAVSGHDDCTTTRSADPGSEIIIDVGLV